MENGADGDHFVALQPQTVDLETGNGCFLMTGPEFLRRLVEEGDSERFEEEVSKVQTYPRLDLRVAADDRTLLHLAAMHGRVEIVRCLLRKLLPNPSVISRQDVVSAQEIVNATDRFGYTPLHLAIRGHRPGAQLEGGESSVSQGHAVGHEEVVRILTTSSWVLPDKFIAATGDRDELQLEIEGFTPLHMAALTGNIPVVKLLLRQSLCRGEYSACDPVNIRATTWKGDSPLDIAKNKGHVELVDLLECFDVNWLQSERDKNANSMNAVLVGAALIVAATFTTWLQPPLGIPSPIPDPVTESLRSQGRYLTAFFVFAALAFALSLAALFIGTFASIPFTGTSLKSEVHYLRMVVRIATYSLFAAILFLNLAFLCASLLVLNKVAFSKFSSNMGNFVICLIFLSWTLCLFRFLQKFRHGKKGIHGEKTFRNLVIYLGIPLLIFDGIIIGIVFFGK